MNNCLVTRLKASVDNSNLPYLDFVEVKVNFPEVENGYFGISLNYNGSPEGKAFVVGDGYFTNANGDNLGKVLSGGIINTRLSFGTYSLYVEAQYLLGLFIDRNLSSDNVFSTTFDITQIDKLPNIDQIDLSCIKPIGNVDKIKLTKNISTFVCPWNYGLSGTLTHLIETLNPSSIVIDNQNITGNLGDLLTEENTLRYPKLKQLIRAGSRVTGTAEQMELLRSLGMTIS